jgi:hypothetical protein
MPAGNTVRPHKWTNVIDLYDDGDNSAIWGSYELAKDRCLGVRWNGGTSTGYPNQGDNPLWYVEPDFVTKNILLELLDRVNSNPAVGNITNILLALREFQP